MNEKIENIVENLIKKRILVIGLFFALSFFLLLMLILQNASIQRDLDEIISVLYPPEQSELPLKITGVTHYDVNMVETVTLNEKPPFFEGEMPYEFEEAN